MAVFEGLRTPASLPLNPGARGVVILKVRAPDKPGAYRLCRTRCGRTVSGSLRLPGRRWRRSGWPVMRSSLEIPRRPPFPHGVQIPAGG